MISAEPVDLEKSSRIGIHYQMDPEWHIYWKNPGDSGAAPKFNLEGGEITKIHWPFPKRIPVSSLTNYGYEKEVVIYLDLKLNSESPKLNLEWLVCKVDCVPGFGTFDLKVDKIFIESELYERFKQRWPSQKSEWTSEFRLQDKESFVFDLSPPTNESISSFSNIFIFPEDGTHFLTAAPQTTIEGQRLVARMPISTNANLVQKAHRFTVVSEKSDQEKTSFTVEVSSKTHISQYLLGLLLAFIGGLILNLMPCVFPVLFLKGYSFLKSSEQKKIRYSSWLYTAGVLFSFLIIGGLLIGLKALGHSVGWGFQLQNPYVLMVLIVLFFLMALSFLDVVNIEKLIPSSIYNLDQSKYFSGDFGTGVLAVVVASPCTAPFMGTALGLTLVLPAHLSLLIFLSIGAGLATPVPLLAHWPWLINKLPKSGPWLGKLKKVMAIPLFLTCAWLVWVFVQSKQVNGGAFDENWTAFEPSVVEMQRDKTSVFIDFTAAWCITCQVNKKTVLNTEEIQKLFSKENVYLVKADWTNYNKEITQALAGFGRNSVPLYVYYRKAEREPVILPELLTKKDIYKLFSQGDSK